LYAEGNRYHLLTRPRRFGKSLLISTLSELFKGNKELFKDLWIAQSDFAFVKHPVVQLDFSGMSHSSPQSLENALAEHLVRIGKYYNIELDEKRRIKELVTDLVPQLAQINEVVLLVDEYDHPLISYVNKNDTLALENQTVLKDFYDAIKSLDIYFRAIFITGVTKFSKTSIFSGFSTLTDISESPKFATLLGYSEEEVSHYFGAKISEFSIQKGVPEGEIRSDMRQWYDGYRFSTSETKVYNPFSIVSYLQDMVLANYWFDSGTPSFLIQLLNKDPMILHDIEGKSIDASRLKSWDIGSTPTIVILYQAGYLTIKSYSMPFKTISYTLGYPNEEVRLTVSQIIVGLLANKPKDVVTDSFHDLKAALLTDNIPLFCQTFQSLLDGITYHHHKRDEAFYHAFFEFLILGLGFEGESEVATSKGRIDFVLTTNTTIYLFEIKLDAPPEAAMKQIDDRCYADKYKTRGKRVILVGLSFEWKEKKLFIHCMQKEFVK
jgi:Predicted AAA-ATPase/PD-(D/E)XK nuclease superfamily